MAPLLPTPPGSPGTLREAVVAQLVADGVWAVGDAPAPGAAPPAGAGLPPG